MASGGRSDTSWIFQRYWVLIATVIDVIIYRHMRVPALYFKHVSPAISTSLCRFFYTILMLWILASTYSEAISTTIMPFYRDPAGLVHFFFVLLLFFYYRDSSHGCWLTLVSGDLSVVWACCEREGFLELLKTFRVREVF